MKQHAKIIRLLLNALFYMSLTIQHTSGYILSVPSNEFTTISSALIKARNGDTVIVKPGMYKEQIHIMSGVYLLSEELGKATIDGKGRGEVVTLTHKSTIDGFCIMNGSIGVTSRGPENCIKHCKIFNNRGSGVICMVNLIEIINTLIVFNQGSGIQALDISSGKNIIEHNTISYNENNGITYKGSMPFTIQNNIIAYNGGMAIQSDKIKARIINNLFFENRDIRFAVPENNITANPLFVAPKSKIMDFSLKPDSPAIQTANDAKNIGATIP